jgi:hypothetical protein
MVCVVKMVLVTVLLITQVNFVKTSPVKHVAVWTNVLTDATTLANVQRRVLANATLASAVKIVLHG